MEEEFSLKDIFIALFNQKKFIIIVTFLCLIVGVCYYIIPSDKIEASENSSIINSKNETYSASNLFTLGSKEKIVTTTSNENISEEYLISDGILAINSNLIEIYTQVLKSKNVFDVINEEFSLNLDYDEWRSAVSLSQPTKDVSILSITFKYDDSDIATRVVDRLTEILEDKIEEIYSTYKVTSPIIIIQDATASEITTAITTTQQSTSKSLKKAIFIPIAGFLLASIIVVIIDILNGTIKNKEQLEKSLTIKTLAVIPKNEKEAKEQLKMLRINISECNKMLITSVLDTEKRNWVAVNLAKSFTKLNKKVLLIDLNNENINLIKDYNKKGLSDYLNSNDKFVEKYANETNIKNLSILTLGNNLENVTELLESQKMYESMNTLERLFDVIIINSGNILESANTLAVSKVSKYSILVLKNRKDKLENSIRAKRNIEDIGGIVVGTVLSL